MKMETESNMALNIVELTMEHLSEKAKAEMVKKVIRGEIRDTIRKSGHKGADKLLMIVAEKLQRKMDAEGSAQFNQTLLDVGGVDARRPVYGRGSMPVDTLEDIARLAVKKENIKDKY